MSRRGGGGRRSGRDQQTPPTTPAPVPTPSVQRGGRSGGGRGRGRGRSSAPEYVAATTPTATSPPTVAPTVTQAEASASEVAVEVEQRLTAPVPTPSVQRGGRSGGGRGRGRGRSSAPEYVAATTPTATSPPTVAPTVTQAEASASEVAVEVEQRLTLQAQPPAQSPPSSSKAVTFPRRPGFGTVGRKCVVRANHFLVRIADCDLYHYDVTIRPEVTSKKVNRGVMTELCRLYGESHLGRKKPAYDGGKSIYTAGPLPFSSKEFVVRLPDDASSSGQRREREFKVAIKFASKPDIHHLQQFLRSRQLDVPQETIQVLDVVLRQTPSEMYTAVARSFFHPDLGTKGELGDGLEFWRGYYQSLRPTQMGLSLNIDVSARSFYEAIGVHDFVFKHFYLRDFSRPLSDQDRVKVRKALKGIRVEVSHTGHRKIYKISGISLQPISQLSFTDDSNQTVSVVQYFRRKYNITLKFVNLPAIQAGNESRPIYLPMEVCRIVPGQRYSKKLNEKQVTALLRATCQRPIDRERSIGEMVRKNRYNADSLVREFAIQVGEDLTLVDARVLPPPMLRYHDTGREQRENPRMGKWNMINKKMVNGGRVDFWTCVNFSRMNQDVLFRFCQELVDMCNSKGMVFNPNPLLPPKNSHPGQIERELRDVHRLVAQKGKQLQLLVIVLPDATGSYGRIKRVCETELGIVSQCCQPRQAARMNKQYFENVALKINVKVGGRNTVLNDAIQRRIPLVTDVPTIIIGADVTHPQPGEDSSPSIAAVVASMDWPEVTKYRGMVSAQAHREEIIQDLYKSSQNSKGELVHGGFIREILRAFRLSTGLKPQRIIFYRDGVSEGQFSQVLLYEMDAIRKACASLESGYLPPVTFVVVQKRHHTRLFPADHRNRDQTDPSGNIQPGTVVDTKICHPTEFDFYLNSHAGIQGTSRPTHYHVLYDENRFNADALQVLTNNLCYTYARCTRSVSIVPPAYYAHLAAFRARYYIEGDSSDAGSSSGGGGGGGFRQLPLIKDNVKEVMFYC